MASAALKWTASAMSGAFWPRTRRRFRGRALQLTIDLDLQAVAELTMENRRGAVVALDPRTGEVLAMVSRPAFDPNLFAGRIRTKDWKDLDRQSGSSADESRDSSAAGARLDIQADHGAGRFGDRCDR